MPRSAETPPQISPFYLNKLIVAKAAAAAPNGGNVRLALSALVAAATLDIRVRSGGLRCILCLWREMSKGADGEGCGGAGATR